MARRRHDWRARKNPGSDAAGVVGATSRAIHTLAPTCKCECHSRILAPAQKKTPAWVQIERTRSTASRQVATVEPY